MTCFLLLLIEGLIAFWIAYRLLRKEQAQRYNIINMLNETHQEISVLQCDLSAAKDELQDSKNLAREITDQNSVAEDVLLQEINMLETQLRTLQTPSKKPRINKKKKV